MKLNSKEKEALSNAHPVSKKFFTQKLTEGYEFDFDMRTLFLRINTAEQEIYEDWREDCLKSMRKAKLCTILPKLFNQVSDLEMPTKQALDIVRKAYSAKEYENQKREIKKMISRLQKQADKEEKFYHLALEKLEKESSAWAIQKVAYELNTGQSVRNDYAEFPPLA